MKKILVIAPHPDDEILGCGGTIIRNIEEGNEVYVCIVTKGTPPLFKLENTEITRKEARDCHAHIGIKKTLFLDFPAVMIEKENRYEINEKILNVLLEIKPDEVFLPHWGDMQKDHQVVTDACMVALRPKYSHGVKRIYAYETLSETGWNVPNIQNDFIPNIYINIDGFLEKKLEALSFFKSQITPFPDARSLDTVVVLAKYRGSMMHMSAAEAFVLIREIQ